MARNTLRIGAIRWPSPPRALPSPSRAASRSARLPEFRTARPPGRRRSACCASVRVPNVPTARAPAATAARVPQGNANGQTARSSQGGGNASKAATAPGLAKTPKDVQRGASLLKKLNAAHASDRALERASDKSIVGAIADYKEDAKQALADIDTYTDKVADGLTRLPTRKAR